MTALGDRLRELLRRLVGAGDLSAATARIAVDGETVATAAAGWAEESLGVAAGDETLYDLASLTKVATATLALVLHQDGELSLEARIGDLFPEARPGLAERRFEKTLRHTTGLAAWVPLYAIDRHPADALGQVLEGAFLPVTTATYSDLGYIVWGQAAELATGRPLATLLSEKVLRPLGMASTMALPGPRPDVAECFLDNGREIELAAQKGILLVPDALRRQGAPQDGNARFLGGLGGHAGLFAPAADVVRLAEEWRRPGTILDPDLVESALAGNDEGKYALGWWHPDAVPDVAGGWPSDSYGMFGFTGGVVWVDPERRLVATLLGHRLRSSRKAAGYRREFLQLAREAARL